MIGALGSFLKYLEHHLNVIAIDKIANSQLITKGSFYLGQLTFNTVEKGVKNAKYNVNIWLQQTIIIEIE